MTTRFICLVIICVLLNSCAHSQINDSSERIKQALDKKKHFYQKKDRDKLFEYIDEQYYPGYKEFQYQIENFLYNHSNIQLDFNIEKILSSGKMKSVELKWYKTYVNKQGRPIKRQGFATFFFDVSGDKILLRNLKGDNPFTQ